jgi:hypothetical protein
MSLPGSPAAGQCRFEHRIPDIAAAQRVPFGQRAEIHVVGERRARGMHLHTPDLLALLDAGHLEQDVRANATFERRIEIRRQIGREDDHAVEAFELLQQHVDHRVGLAHERLIE